MRRVCYNLYAAFQDKQLARYVQDKRGKKKKRGPTKAQDTATEQRSEQRSEISGDTGKNTYMKGEERRRRKKETMQEFNYFFLPKWRLLGPVGGHHIHVRDRAGGSHWCFH